MALDSAGLTRGDVDMVVCGTAPDAFDGVAMKVEYLLDGSGGYRKPYTRVFTGGGTGVVRTNAGSLAVGPSLAAVLLLAQEEMMSLSPALAPWLHIEPRDPCPLSTFYPFTLCS